MKSSGARFGCFSAAGGLARIEESFEIRARHIHLTFTQ